MNKEQIIEQIRYDLSCAYLESNDLILRLSNIDMLYDNHKEGLAFKRQLKQAANRYLNASKGFMNELEKLSDKISDESKYDSNDNYRKLLDELPKAMGRLDVSLNRIINNEK